MILLRPRPASVVLLNWKTTWSLSHPAGPPIRAFSTSDARIGAPKLEDKKKEEEEEEEEEDILPKEPEEELDYDPTAFVPKRTRSAQQIKALVQNVELVREQIKTPISNDSVRNLASSQGLITVPKQANLFIPLQLDENRAETEIAPRKTRYMIQMDIVRAAESGKKPSRRVLAEFDKGLNPPEIQMLVTAVPTSEVLDKAFAYCAVHNYFRASCTVMSLCFANETREDHIRKHFVNLMKQPPFGHDSPHILATLQAAKKAKFPFSGAMFSALISRLALSPDCNPETIKDLIKQADEAKKILTLKTYNDLLRYFATTQDFEQCRHIEELARKIHGDSKDLSITLCLLTQAACIVHKPDSAWEYYLELKQKSPDCLVTFKHLYKHILAVLTTEAEKHMDRITTLFSDLQDTNINVTELKNLLQKRPGFPYYCISILTYSRQKGIKPHPQFASFVAAEMFELRHSDVIRYYLEYQHDPNANVAELLGSILYYIPAKEEHTSMLENILSGLHPISSKAGKSSEELQEHQYVRDANVFAIAIDMYSKLARKEAVVHTYNFMIHEGALPNFLVHALLFRFYFHAGGTVERDFHFGHIRKHITESSIGTEFSWLSSPLLVYYCAADSAYAGDVESPFLAELRKLIPRAVPYLGVDKRSLSFEEAVSKVAQASFPLALTQVRAMQQYDAKQITAVSMQPIINTMLEGAKDTTKKGKIGEELDILTYIKEIKFVPALLQAKRILPHYEKAQNLTPVTQFLQHIVTCAPSLKKYLPWLAEVCAYCAKRGAGAQVAGVIKQMEGKEPFTQEQYVLIIRNMVAHMATQHALDLLKWMSEHMRTAFEPLREELLRDNPDAAWAKALSRISTKEAEST